MSSKVGQLKRRVLGAAECVLEVKGYVSPIELLKQMGFLAPSSVRMWEKGVHDCLEPHIQCGPKETGGLVQDLPGVSQGGRPGYGTWI